jgi:hypothetical protein
MKDIERAFQELISSLEDEVQKTREEARDALDKKHDALADRLLKEIKRISYIRDKISDMFRVLKGEREGPKGDRILIIDGEEFNFHFTYEILTITAEWLITKGRLTEKKCPVHIFGKRYIINTVPENPGGKKFITENRQLSNGLFMETAFSEKDAIKNARRLLIHFGFKGFLEIKD